MTELFEFRVDERYRDRLFSATEGVLLGSGRIRKITLSSSDPRLAEIGKLQKELLAKIGKPLYFGWNISRKYSKSELSSANAFLVDIRKIFEPAGEEYGTLYDESRACPQCGAGALQRTPLSLPPSRIPKNTDFSKTIAGEIVVSANARDVLHAAHFEGVHFDPILSSKSKNPLDSAFQLRISSPPISISPSTHIADGPFAANDLGCARKDLLGLNLISELHITGVPRGISLTREFIGVRRGLLRPERLLIASLGAKDLLERARLKGLDWEIARVTTN